VTTRFNVLPAIFLAICLHLSAATTTIGSVVSQGDLRIDSRTVKESGTVFDGSLIETGHGAVSSAAVRLNGNSTLTLYADSRGTFYGDHLILIQGEAKVAAASPFRTEVTGLKVLAAEPYTTGLISVGLDGKVNIEAETGSFSVAKDDGQFLARVTSREPLALYRQANGEWQAGYGSRGEFGRDDRRCYLDDRDDHDDRECDRHHHRHPSK
jgi:hypothetical protein